MYLLQHSISRLVQRERHMLVVIDVFILCDPPIAAIVYAAIIGGTRSGGSARFRSVDERNIRRRVRWSCGWRPLSAGAAKSEDNYRYGGARSQSS